MRNRVALALAVVLVAVPTLGGAADAGGAKTVKLGDNFFEPTRVKVRKGTKVRFKWIGDEPHNVVKQRGPGRAFASDITTERGVNFKQRFRKKGRYLLVCTIHLESDDMKMRIRVR